MMGRLEQVRDYYEEQGYRRITLRARSDYGGGVDNELHGYRLETKQECAKRLERNKKAREAAKKREAKKKHDREARDRREFARLQKKFGAAKSCDTCKAQVDASHDCRKCKKGSNWAPLPTVFDPE